MGIHGKINDKINGEQPNVPLNELIRRWNTVK